LGIISLAAPAKYSVRAFHEPKHPYRSEFMRDRDRIMYSKAFRRLVSKTQVFITGFDDHVRNRLTHTLEVAQIARTIACKLKLDTDLTEAIALGHDLGHTPFGHVGERTLNLIMNNCDPITRDYCQVGSKELVLDDCVRGFKHNLQSIRVVTELSSSNYLQPNGTGLNLTNFTLFGIWHHSKTYWKQCENGKKNQCFLYPKAHVCANNQHLSVGYYKKYEKFITIPQGTPSWSFEALIAAHADEIAQRHHDVEDALEGKLIAKKEVVDLIEKYFAIYIEANPLDKSNFKILKEMVDPKKEKKETIITSKDFLTLLSRFIVNFLVDRLLKSSSRNLDTFIKKYGLKNKRDFEKQYPAFTFEEVKELIDFEDKSIPSDGFNDAHKQFQEELRKLVLNAHSVQRMDGKARYIIRRIFKAYLSNPQQLPDKTIISLFREYDPKFIPTLRSDGEIDIGQLRDQLDHLHKLAVLLKDDANYDQHSEKTIVGDNTNEKKDDLVRFRIALLRVICDYVAGMTDSYAIKDYENLYN
jgi:dGTPase